MTKKSKLSDESAKLRKKAEKKLAESQENMLGVKKQKQLHELMIHQIELEMQNEELKKLRLEAEASLENYTNLYDLAPIPYMTLGADSSILNANKAATKMLKEEHKDLLHKRFGIFVTDDSKPVFNSFIDKVFASQKQEICEISILINERLTWYILTAIGDRSRKSILVAAQDITKQKIAEEIILREANYDLITGLPNRRLFQDRLQQEIIKTHRTKRKFALLFLDVDRFKDINDRLGHAMGDLVLKETALRLSACIRATDTVARSGGDEFIIIMGDLNDFVPVGRVANCLLNSMRVPFLLSNISNFVSISIGIAIFPDDAVEANELMKKADQAMYSAKNEGRDCYRYFTAEMQEYIQNRLNTVNDLHAVIEEHQLKINYQPIVELSSGHIHKTEALIRWQHPKNGVISPLNFIPIAEEMGIMIGIDNWVVQQVTQQIIKWRKMFYKDFQVCLNISSVHFKSTRSHSTSWLYHLDKLVFNPHSIILEINEDLLIEDQGDISNQLMKFQEKNIKISLNDYGTGYSTLLTLNKYNIDYLKISRNFVANITAHSNTLALCEAIIDMAHKLNIKVIAVGVETKEQHDLLIAAGCDYGQGYLYSKPLPSDEFERFMIDG